MIKEYVVHYTLSIKGREVKDTKTVYAASPNDAEDLVVGARICNYADVDRVELATRETLWD
jgi:hypothetical protein